MNAAKVYATLVLRSANVYTLNPARPRTQAVAARNDRIVAVGTDAEIQDWIDPQGSTHVIDCQGKFVMPGFIEGHGHFLSLGESKLKLDLTAAKSWDEIVEQVARAAKSVPAGQWIEGRGWHQGKWSSPPIRAVQGYPHVAELSRAVPDHPVLLTHGTGHMCIANARAMELAGIHADSKPPTGGEILRDEFGQPCGVFRETAMRPIGAALARSRRNRAPDEIRREQRGAMQAASRECLRFGVTSFQDAGVSCDEVDALREYIRDGELPIRLWIMLNESNEVLAKRLRDYRTIGFSNQHLTVRGIKRMFDGALGTHGAWMLEPYDDLPNSRGLNTLAINDLKRSAELALEHDFQLCVHAIGDRANRETLDVFEWALQSRSDGQANSEKAKRDVRWRIEHAQHIDPADFARFKSLGVIASMQANHATSDGPFVVQRLGERRAKLSSYAWRSLLDSGAVLSNGTDAPVETLNPLDSLFASVTRMMANGQAFYPEQCLTREEALRSYTVWAAFAGFEEDIKGALKVGMLADMVIVSHDLSTVSAAQLPTARVEQTIIGGRVVFP